MAVFKRTDEHYVAGSLTLPQQYYTADEVFVTGSGAGIVPVTEVDKRMVSGGRPGELTRRITDLYSEAVKSGESAYE